MRILHRRGNAVQILWQAVDWIYDKAQSGYLGADSASELAEDYLHKAKSREDAINSLIRWQVRKAGAVGFVTGAGGFISLPVSLPANLTSVFYIQLRMVIAIAQLRGYDPQSDQVKTFAFASMCGAGAVELVKSSGERFGASLSAELLKRIGVFVQRRLFARAGRGGFALLPRLAPIVGGFASGGIDAAATKAIAAAAKQFFPPIIKD